MKFLFLKQKTVQQEQKLLDSQRNRELSAAVYRETATYRFSHWDSALARNSDWNLEHR